MHRSLLVLMGMLAGALALGCNDRAGITDPAKVSPGEQLTEVQYLVRGQ